MAHTKCDRCNGSGKCQRCGGTGLIREIGVERMKETECRECNRTDHNGADFKSTVGSKVYAVLDEVIVYARECSGFGSLNSSTPGGVIVIRHPDNRGGRFYAIYGHLYRNTSLLPGMSVTRGQVPSWVRR